jgi:hypothetical protein
MGRLAALGCDPTPIAYGPMWMAPVWMGVVRRAEAVRAEWSRIDAVNTINALSEAM